MTWFTPAILWLPLWNNSDENVFDVIDLAFPIHTPVKGAHTSITTDNKLEKGRHAHIAVDGVRAKNSVDKPQSL